MPVAARKSLRGPGAIPKPSEEPLVPAISLPDKAPEWSSTAVDGSRVITLPDGGHDAVAGVLSSLATCPQSGQVSTLPTDKKALIVLCSVIKHARK